MPSPTRRVRIKGRYSWETFLLRVVLDLEPLEEIKARPDDRAPRWGVSKSEPVRYARLEGEWIRVETAGNEAAIGYTLVVGWQRWRRGNRLLVTYSVHGC